MPKSFDDDPAEDNDVLPDSFDDDTEQTDPVAASRTRRNTKFTKSGLRRAVTVPSVSVSGQPEVNIQKVDTSSFKDATIDPELLKESWMKCYWRPAMGWLYLVVCAFDFILFPIMWTAVQFWEQDIANDAFRQWNPLTLQGAGLFHMAMGAVLGIAAWGRTQEKNAGKN
jgi:hypothetical protein